MIVVLRSSTTAVVVFVMVWCGWVLMVHQVASHTQENKEADAATVTVTATAHPSAETKRNGRKGEEDTNEDTTTDELATGNGRVDGLESWEDALRQVIALVQGGNFEDEGNSQRVKRAVNNAILFANSEQQSWKRDPIPHLNGMRDDGAVTVRLHLTIGTLVAISVVLALSFLGALYVFKLCTKQRCSCPLCDNEYEIVKRLGTGGFGTVYKVKLAENTNGFNEQSPSSPRNSHRVTEESYSNDTDPKKNIKRSEEYVLKQIPVTDFNDASIAQAEARELRALHHPRIVRYEDDFLHFTTDLTSSDQKLFVCIVMESCAMDIKKLIERVRTKCPGWRSAKCRDLDSYLEHQHSLSCCIPETVVLRIIGQIAEGLQYCHGKGIIHRDVKSQNAFLTPFGDIRLGDFGLARQVRSPYTIFTDAGTDCYKAPEMLLGGRRDGRTADIWALGLVIFEIATLSFVWERQSSGIAGDVLNRGEKAVHDFLRPVPTGYSPVIRKLLRKCLHSDPKKRPTPKDILRLRAVQKALTSNAPVNKNSKRRSSTGSTKTRHSHENESPRSWSSGSGGSVGTNSTPVYNFFGWDPSRDVSRNLKFNEAVRELPFDNSAADGGIFAGFGTFLNDVQYASSVESSEDEKTSARVRTDSAANEGKKAQTFLLQEDKEVNKSREPNVVEEKKTGPLVIVAPGNNEDESTVDSEWVTVARKKGKKRK